MLGQRRRQWHNIKPTVGLHDTLKWYINPQNTISRPIVGLMLELDHRD